MLFFWGPLPADTPPCLGMITWSDAPPTVPVASSLEPLRPYVDSPFAPVGVAQSNALGFERSPDGGGIDAKSVADATTDQPSS